MTAKMDKMDADNCESKAHQEDGGDESHPTEDGCLTWRGEGLARSDARLSREEGISFRGDRVRGEAPRSPRGSDGRGCDRSHRGPT
jgi:hypothetical protein